MSGTATAGTVLVTGATGYIGGRLVPRLLDAGYRVRVLARSARKLADRPWAARAGVGVIEGDVGDGAALGRALAGCTVAYYLVHSMMAVGEAYAEHDRRLAEGFGRAAAAAGVGRIIYLGGLGEIGADLSEHLTSRREVEGALAAGGVPVTVLRAAMIIGSGSASFEILRYLVERLPVMVTPRWVRTPCQPIAVANVLHALIACARLPETAGRTLDLGGAEVVTYLELMRTMAEALGLRRRVIVPVPVLTPRLSSLWIHLVTPIEARIARPLAEGLRNPVVCRDDTATRLIPQRLLGVREAIDAALMQLATHDVESSWSDAGLMPGDPDWAGGTVYTDRRSVEAQAGPDRVFAAVSRIGGRHGWYASDALWRVRGWLDMLLGGPGLRRGRRDPEELRLGDAVDFWRVRRLEPGRELTLAAEMRLPGVAELTFTVAPLSVSPPRSRLEQTARFKPRGLFGIAYWWLVKPLHGIVFADILRGVRREAESMPVAEAIAPVKTVEETLAAGRGRS